MNKFLKEFAVFILTAKRPNNIKTLNALKRGGYTGKTYLLVDDDDPTQNEYKKNFGDMVILLDKNKAISITDSADNFQKRNAVVFARNMCHDIAESLGLKYFLVLDDDYRQFAYRRVIGNSLKWYYLNNLDKNFYLVVKFLQKSNAKTVAYAQAGDYIGGTDGFFKRGIARKAMNSFFCKTDRPFKFYGRINEDVTAYTYLGSQGDLFFTLSNPSVEQTITQTNTGGLTDIYLDLGTYVKSFYSVMYMPSCIKISAMGNHNMRIHHKVSWKNCVPKILHEKYKKI